MPKSSNRVTALLIQAFRSPRKEEFKKYESQAQKRESWPMIARQEKDEKDTTRLITTLIHRMLAS